MRAAAAAVVLALTLPPSLTTGCKHAVTVKVTVPHTSVVVDGQDLGAVPAEGKTIEVAPGMAAVPFEIKHGDQAVVGSVARTEPVWWLVAAGVAGAVCCVPTLATAGFCVANPAIIGAPLALAITGDIGALTAPCVAPSWFTLPVVTGCGAIGLSPLGAALAAETLPDEVVLRPPTAAATAPSGEMGF